MNTYKVEPMKYGGNRSDDYVTGWNDCYAAIEADRKLHDRMLAHEWIRPSLGLDEDAPYRFDFYAQEIEKLKADRKRRGEPAGWRIVPIDPTIEMLDAGDEAMRDFPPSISRYETQLPPKVAYYRAMINAAPQPADPVSGEPVAEVKIEADYWTRGHFYEGKRKEAKLMKAFHDLPVGTKLYAAPQPAEPVNMDLVRKWQAENGVEQDPDSREARMVVIRHDDDGKPTVWCDPEIADLVRALNDGGLATVGSCSGHGWRPGNIMLADGRVLVVCKDADEAREVESHFPGINGEAPLAAEPVRVPSMRDLIADDAYAATFQSVGQYRKALLARYGKGTP